MASKLQHQPEPWSHLDGRIVMVTGASSGIGRELCLDLAKAGCRIVAAARRADRLDSLCHQINEMSIPTNGARAGSSRCIATVLDITADGAAIEESVKKAWGAFGHIDVLINNAGMRGENKSSLELSEKEFNLVLNTNFRGSWLVSKFIGARMRDAGSGGSIINISSVAGLNRTQDRGSIAYGTSKAALDSMTKIMAVELGDYNIRVNSIAPGVFNSEITEKLLQKSWAKTVQMKIVPLRTFGTTDPAMTSIVRYLIHDSSAYITGNIFIADGGLSIPGISIYSSL